MTIGHARGSPTETRPLCGRRISHQILVILIAQLQDTGETQVLAPVQLSDYTFQLTKLQSSSPRVSPVGNIFGRQGAGPPNCSGAAAATRGVAIQSLADGAWRAYHPEWRRRTLNIGSTSYTVPSDSAGPPAAVMTAPSGAGFG